MSNQPESRQEPTPTLGYTLCGFAIVLALVGTVLPGLGVFLYAGTILLSVGSFVWAREKGYGLVSACLLGLLNLVGAVIVYYLPDERKSSTYQENPLYPGH